MNDKGVTQSGRKSRRDVEPERGARGEGMEMEMGWGEAGTTPPPSPPPSPNPQPATQDSPPPPHHHPPPTKPGVSLPDIKGARRLCRLDINIQCAVKAGTVNTLHTKSWLSLAGAQTHNTHSCCGLSWAKEGSRGVLNLTNLYETNTIRTHTQTHTLAHTLSPRL